MFASVFRLKTSGSCLTFAFALFNIILSDSCLFLYVVLLSVIQFSISFPSLTSPWKCLFVVRSVNAKELKFNTKSSGKGWRGKDKGNKVSPNVVGEYNHLI
jgi:hypothetical protein